MTHRTRGEMTCDIPDKSLELVEVGETVCDFRVGKLHAPRASIQLQASLVVVDDQMESARVLVHLCPFVVVHAIIVAVYRS